MQTLNLVIDLSGIVVCLIGLIIVIVSPARRGYRMKFWIKFIIALFFFTASNLCGLLLNGSDLSWARQGMLIATYTEFVTPVLLQYVVILWMLEILDPGRQWKMLRFSIRIVVLLHFLCMLCSQFTEQIYYIDQNNVYHRNTTYPVSYTASLILLGIGMAIEISQRNRLNRNQKFVFTLYFFAPLIGIAIQILYYGLNVIVLMTVLAAIILMVVIMTEYTEAFYRQMADNERLKTEIMLSQIQPHFMYNCLLVIRQICLENPAAAADSLMDFTKFLRHNMESMSANTPIPFREELEHVKCYVSLQRLRFGDELRVEYDLECTAFRLPTLTLQPLVENAIRYGVRKRADGDGFVRVQTREYEDRYEVSVIDNGPGDDLELSEYEDGRLGIALNNIRSRLQSVCGGSFRIGPEEGGGVRATMTLPRR